MGSEGKLGQGHAGFEIAVRHEGGASRQWAEERSSELHLTLSWHPDEVCPGDLVTSGLPVTLVRSFLGV